MQKLIIGTIYSKINGTPKRCSLAHFEVTLYLSRVYYPQKCLLAHFEATLILTVANLLAHNK